jgi:hypothetical protein
LVIYEEPLQTPLAILPDLKLQSLFRKCAGALTDTHSYPMSCVQAMVEYSHFQIVGAPHLILWIRKIKATDACSNKYAQIQFNKFSQPNYTFERMIIWVYGEGCTTLSITFEHKNLYFSHHNKSCDWGWYRFAKDTLHIFIACDYPWIIITWNLWVT